MLVGSSLLGLVGNVVEIAASLGPAVFVVLASYSNDRIWAVVHFTLAMGFMGGYMCGMKVNSMDLSPNFAGTLMGMVNGIGSIMGIIAPYITEVITKDQTVQQWRLVFWIAAVVFTFSFAVFGIWGSGEVQPFNEIEEQCEQDEKA